MNLESSPIISVNELIELTSQDVDLKIFDVSNSKEARSNFEKKHLKNAFFVDINTDLININDDLAIGGRHPLPSIKKFSSILGRLGISPETYIVLYDDKSGANAAARFWWMLKAVGHRTVRVLDGGIQHAEKNNYPLSSGKNIVASVKSYPFSNWKLPVFSMNEVEKIKNNSNYLIIDVRDEKRYNGVFEPIDLIAGHIPNAVNFPFYKTLSDDGTFLSKEKIIEQLETVLKNYNSKNIIIHCGSGVTACHAILAMTYVGFEVPNLYIGSWSEWSRNDNEMVLNSN